jgi:glyoxylase-like metal-dependent hydrolase (beta-lactamase superfamily II)
VNEVTQIPLPLPLDRMATVNTWLLRGDPLTLVDTGLRDDAALAALEQALRRHGLRIEDIELVLATHHHLDHVGLTATIKRRSGARVAVLDRLADYGTEYSTRTAAERCYSRELMSMHGVPMQVIAENEGFWDFIAENSEPFDADTRLVEGDRVRAGGRVLRIVARPGHSTTDTLLVDDAERVAFVGDHVLARVSSNTEIYPGPGEQEQRPQARRSYLENLERTAAMPLARLLTGHGRPVCRHAQLIRVRLAEHTRRSARIAAILTQGPSTAYGIARQLWPARVVREQPLLVLWEVLGHLDLLLASGGLAERVCEDDGNSWFTLDGVAA